MPTSSIPASGGGGLQPRYQKFTSSGTFTLPDGYGAAKPLLVTVQVIGGGGGGAASRFAITSSTSAVNKNGTYNGYFGNGTSINHTYAAIAGAGTSFDQITNQNGSGGGSGGLAATQFYLTENLTITVGAAGARPGIITTANSTNYNTYVNGNGNSLTNGSNSGAITPIWTVNAGSGGTGGTTTAGAVSAVGGVGANMNSATITGTSANTNGGQNVTANNTVNFNGAATAASINSTSVGNAGQPAGSAGDAVPLLGALAGGSGTSTPVYGAYGIGGRKSDGATHTGVEGTGGGFGSIGASGAVILTWWQ
jgi:hypothetical protein